MTERIPPPNRIAGYDFLIRGIRLFRVAAPIQHARKQIIVVVFDEGLRTVALQLAQDLFAGSEIVAIQRGTQLQMLLGRDRSLRVAANRKG